MISLELSDKIYEYIYTEITLEQLEDWLVTKLPDFLKQFDSTDADIVSAIELGLAEINNQNWTEDKFRAYLKDALQEVSVIFEVPTVQAVQITSGSSNLTSEVPNRPPSFEYSVTWS